MSGKSFKIGLWFATVLTALLGVQHHGVDLVQGVDQSRREILAAAVFLDEIEAKCAVSFVFVNVGDCTHQRTKNDLCVVVEKVDLKTQQSLS